MRLRRGLSWAGLLLLAAAAPAAAEGPDVGIAAGYSTRFERPLLALDLLVHVNPSWTVAPNVSYLEAGGVNRWTAAVELQWNAPAHRLHDKLLAWTGAGLGALIEDPDGPTDPTTHDLLANLVLGVGYDAPAVPFFQARITLTDPVDVALSIGVRF